MHPAFPDIVGAAAQAENDNDGGSADAAEEFADFSDELDDHFFEIFDRLAIAATRLW